MAIIEAWKPMLGIGLQTAWGTADVAGTNMIDGKIQHLPTTNLVDLNPNVNFIDSPKFHGNPERKITEDGLTELQVGTYAAGCSVEFDADCRILVPFLFSLLQEVREGNDSPNYTKEFTNYQRTTSLDFNSKTANPLQAPYILTVAKDLGLGGATDQVIKDAVVRSMTFNGSSGETVKVTAEIIGSTFTITTVDTANYALPTESAVPLLFQDCAVTHSPFLTDIGLVYGLVTLEPLDLLSFNMTLTNNAELRYYNSQAASQITFGRFDVSGSITVPLSSSLRNLYVAGTPAPEPNFTGLYELVEGTSHNSCLYWTDNLTEGFFIWWDGFSTWYITTLLGVSHTTVGVTDPLTDGDWGGAGIYNGNVYYEHKSRAYYMWADANPATVWTISTVLGLPNPAGYWTNTHASPLGNGGVFLHQGTATGDPTFAYVDCFSLTSASRIGTYTNRGAATGTPVVHDLSLSGLFLSDEPMFLKLAWGTGEQSLSIEVVCRFSAQTIGGDSEQELELTFSGENYYSATEVDYFPTITHQATHDDGAIRIIITDSSNWTLPASILV